MGIQVPDDALPRVLPSREKRSATLDHLLWKQGGEEALQVQDCASGVVGSCPATIQMIRGSGSGAVRSRAP